MSEVPVDAKWRVKSYALNANRQWDDMGTGDINSCFHEPSNDMSLLVSNESDGSLVLDSKHQLDTEYQAENQEILELEIRKLSLLKSTSQQCCDNTTAIIRLLSEFDDRLTKLEGHIQPVYQKTGNLQIKQSELSKTLEKLDHVIQFYSVSGEEIDFINSGPSNQLEAYMLSLKRLKMALQYFSQNNPHSPEYMNVSSLFKYGCDAIEKEFKLILHRYSLPIAPIVLQDIVEDEHNMLYHQSEKIQDLKIIFQWSCDEEICTHIQNEYADIRSEYVCKSLKALQDFKKSTSTNPRSPRTPMYLTCITAFHKLAMNELNLISSIVPSGFRTYIFNRLVQESLRFITNEATNLTLVVKKSIAKHDFTSVLDLFPILRYQTEHRHSFDLLFDGCQSEALAKFQGLIVTFQATISKSLEEFARFVQNYNDIKVPGDGTVHELTNNVMIFIEQLHPHLDIMSSVIPIKDMQAMENCNDKNKLGFAQYITRLLYSLSDTIQRKAESYTNPQLAFLFKINNYHYILKRLKECGLLEITQSYLPQVKTIYDTLIEDNKNCYLKGLLPIINHLIGQDTRTKSIKERFSSFNKDFQELYRLNRTYAVPDAELRTQIREMCKKELLSYYSRFFQHYVNQDFSKRKEKYIKYTPELVESMIDQFFESN